MNPLSIPEILKSILKHTTTSDLGNHRCVSKLWNEAIQSTVDERFPELIASSHVRLEVVQKGGGFLSYSSALNKKTQYEDFADLSIDDGFFDEFRIGDNSNRHRISFIFNGKRVGYTSIDLEESDKELQAKICPHVIMFYHIYKKYSVTYVIKVDKIRIMKQFIYNFENRVLGDDEFDQPDEELHQERRRCLII